MADRVVPAGSSSTDYLKKPYKLLRQGADATVTDEDGNGAFHYLVQSDMFKSPAAPRTSFWARRVRAPSPVDDPSMTMEGLIHGLQAAGADINLQNKDGETPLHVLCRNASSRKKLDDRLCESLCQAGADLNIRDGQGRSAVFCLFLTGPLNYWNKDKGEHLCQLVSRLGGRFDVQDNYGRNVIHCLLSSKGDVHLSLVEALARHGVDPSAVDDEGNTLWHTAVDRLARPPQGDKPLSDLLLRLGADPQKPNKRGRNPLDGMSSLQAPVLSWPLKIFPACIPDLRTTAFDCLLQIYLETGYDLDFRDNQGITPLHLTCTFSEYQAGRLLQAGANPKIPTHEGLTPFHLAARCRQANIIGLLLDKAKRGESGSGGLRSSSIHEFANAKDAHGKTALYYACASGRAESVALLLDAGWSVQSDEYSGSVWQACAEFEEEQMNWSSSPAALGTQLTASSVLMEDKKRPILDRANKFSREHLVDVLRLLLQRQDAPGAIAGYLDKSISVAAAKQLDYTVECLVQARKSLQHSLELGIATITLDGPTSACLARVSAHGIAEAASLSPQALRAEFKRLMELRRHNLVQKLLLEHGWGELDGDGNTFIHDLVQHGFISVLRGLTPLVKELSTKLEDVEWCDKQKLASSKASFINGFPKTIDQHFGQGSTQPLLLAACRSEEPNMEVIRFLVEEIGCNVNTQGYLRVRIPNSPTGHGICKHETPIHTLVRGKTNWWHTSEALSYLAQNQGANLEVKDYFQSTPLAVAVSHIGRVTFNRGAVDRLLEFGADAKAVDLSWTCESAELTNLLLSRGAIVKPAAILAAVRSRNCDVLDMLLSRGGDVNARETSVLAAHHHQDTAIYVETTAPPREKWLPRTEFEERLRGDRCSQEPEPPPPPVDTETTTFTIPAPPYVPERQMYPLDYAAHLFSRQPELDEFARESQPGGKHVEVNHARARPLPADELARVIELLIAHGADVKAAYKVEGARMSIKDRIVQRAAECRLLPLGRPQLARKILELCKVDPEGVL
ncbi:hypothetical protein J7T55_012363 [Diaporthe amygdali]|uniref:uncharacterized protein n=1 Tax=Phomopsis amygdali TaxID=1214568 RepID=UPI0022FEB0FA|nr:uncharacterized protein J7T55_012363 [Diaporthe amygdali]KAJ0123891.1 hypothetical protein J7T55_012363 [Diaporthe amygdali]